VNRTLIPTDDNTLDLLKDYTITNGRNYDVLIKIQDNHITAKTLQQLVEDPTCRVSSKICYEYSQSFPWIDRNNLKETVFKDWIAPSFYLNFKENNGTITVQELPQHTISLEEYIKTAKNRVEANMKHILDTSSDLILLYSRGIDSLLLLSYLMKYNRLKDTRLVHLGDTANQQSFVDLSLEKQLGFNIDTIFINQNIVMQYANQSNPFKFKMFLNHALAKQFKNKTLLIGYDGNSVLMHKWEWVKRLGKPTTKKNNYVKSCDTVDWSQSTDLHHHTISMIEPYGRNWNNPKDFSRTVSPISDVELMRMLPFVDIRNMDPNFVGDAVMIRDMIHDNVGDALDSLIHSETVTWLAPILTQSVNTELLDETALTINIKRRVDVRGVTELLRRIDGAKLDKKINFADLLSIKYINYFQ